MGDFKNSRYFIYGTLPFLLAQGWYNLVCFGSVFKLSYQYHLAGSAFQALTAKGLFGISYPSGRTFLQLLFSPARGVLFCSPALVFSALGFWEFYRRGFKKESLFLASIIGLFFLFNSGYPSWEGGLVPGTRYLIPIFPFLGFCLLGLDRKYFNCLFLVTIISVLINFSITSTATHIAEKEHRLILNAVWERIKNGAFGYNWGNIFWGWNGGNSLIPYFLLIVALGIILAYLIKLEKIKRL